MGIGLFGFLTLIFVVCKLFHVIDWSWWLVFTPSLVTLVIWFIVMGLVLIGAWRG